MSFYKTVRDTTVHVIGKCPVKGCKSKPKRVTVPGVVKADRVRTWTEWALPAPAPYDKGIYGGAYINYGARPSTFPVHYGAFEKTYLALMHQVGWVCTEHDRFFTLKTVKGVVNQDKSCNARCTGATGMDCECSCGGRMHGAAHD